MTDPLFGKRPARFKEGDAFDTPHGIAIVAYNHEPKGQTPSKRADFAIWKIAPEAKRLGYNPGGSFFAHVDDQTAPSPDDWKDVTIPSQDREAARAMARRVGKEKAETWAKRQRTKVPLRFARRDIAKNVALYVLTTSRPTVEMLEKKFHLSPRWGRVILAQRKQAAQKTYPEDVLWYEGQIDKILDETENPEMFLPGRSKK